ncbi:hypothetical protein BDV95DRAFT_599681 [Massariosphaeria phaeospora]|uniref:Uncharacterized protein n=1 Tax=Massariosphaeria phaeospora TaxID=100035 RepID=A0A7C8I696_9PLEO|nr:hypothetical protein BDV95DRAFT_599681 [Massariosphaeria phaeospora]
MAYDSPYNNNNNNRPLSSWRTITSIGDGHAWAAGQSYPPIAPLPPARPAYEVWPAGARLGSGTGTATSYGDDSRRQSCSTASTLVASEYSLSDAASASASSYHKSESGSPRESSRAEWMGDVAGEESKGKGGGRLRGEAGVFWPTGAGSGGYGGANRSGTRSESRAGSGTRFRPQAASFVPGSEAHYMGRR